MITALDTNILLDVLLPNDMRLPGAALETAAAEGPLIICDDRVCGALRTFPKPST